MSFFLWLAFIVSVTHYVTQAEFFDIRLENETVIWSEEVSDLKVSFCSFIHVESNLENACIYSSNSTSIIDSTCFRTIRVSHLSGMVRGGSCLSLIESFYNISRMSLVDTTTNKKSIHSSLMLRNSVGYIEYFNQSRSLSISEGHTSRGICFQYSTQCRLSFATFVDCRGGNSLYSEFKEENPVDCKRVIFANIIPDGGYLIDYEGRSINSTFSNCICVKCDVNFISNRNHPMSSWYIDQKPPNFLISTIEIPNYYEQSFQLCKEKVMSCRNLRRTKYVILPYLFHPLASLQ